MDNGYQLLDAGDQRRLERFGRHLVDRPAPGATAPRRDPAAWPGADLRFERWSGWHMAEPETGPWSVAIDRLTLELRPTESGQVGLFPEHLAGVGWLRDRVPIHRLAATAPGHDGDAGGPAATGDQLQVLNLFAYTGLASLALAAAGASVVHVDASRPAVAWARRNAVLSDLADRPVRWIVDEAEAFVARELRRGRRYDGIVLDPPSYGHGADGRPWRLEERLPGLLAACARLLRDPRGFCLLTAHTPGHGADRLATLLAGALSTPAAAVAAGELALTAVSGARLDLGAFARFDGRAR